jgi:hypothetical protein
MSPSNEAKLALPWDRFLEELEGLLREQVHAGGAYIEGDVCATPSDTVQSMKPLGRIVETGDVVRPVTFSDCPWITAHSETIHLVVNALLTGEALLCKAVGSTQ